MEPSIRGDRLLIASELRGQFFRGRVQLGYGALLGRRELRFGKVGNGN